ncbi:hypothetical protein [Paraburkholderia tropica]|uniref:hypothetical protein n=1 Tax=Paraburkholderia tropica TaxID=92647 RepID=UPI002AB6ED59|nr:hypothetical protein [Paraburkholderia tropica]
MKRPQKSFDRMAEISMTIEQFTRLIGDDARVADVVGIGITEHLPRDVLTMKAMFARTPLLGTPVTNEA